MIGSGASEGRRWSGLCPQRLKLAENVEKWVLIISGGMRGIFEASKSATMRRYKGVKAGFGYADAAFRVRFAHVSCTFRARFVHVSRTFRAFRARCNARFAHVSRTFRGHTT